MRCRTGWGVVVTTFLIGFIGGCSQHQRAEFGELFAIQQKLIAQYHCPTVGVSVKNDRLLVVDFVNSRFNKLGEAKRAKQARRIAAFTARQLKQNRQVNEIGVAFSRHERKYLIVNFNWMVGSYVFQVAVLMHVPDATGHVPTG